MPANRILAQMLERLYAAMTQGPSLNCRPHASRQRADFASLQDLADLPPVEALRQLMGEAGKARIAASVPMPPELLRENPFRSGPVESEPASDGPTAADPASAEPLEAPWKDQSPAWRLPDDAQDLAPAPDSSQQQAPTGAARAAPDERAAIEASGDEAQPKNTGSPDPAPGDAGVQGSRTEQPAASRPGRKPPLGVKPVNRPGSNPQAVQAWRAQKALLTKLRSLSADALTYEQDTGVRTLFIGYPILSLPPGMLGGGTKRVLAPVAFIPVTLEVNTGRKPLVELACSGSGAERVMPNEALMAFLDRETEPAAQKPFQDEEGLDPWRELREILADICRRLQLDPAAAEALSDPDRLTLGRTPTADELPATPALLPAAVLGLFPAANQGLLRDTQEMIRSERIEGPVMAFLDARAELAAAPVAAPQDEAQRPAPKRLRSFTGERLVSASDPFQALSVEKARTSRGLVVHGPPGTGKSQTITNIIGDHLALGQRVLFVCDKRTALDVVANRLNHLGLGSLCAVVHDPQRDQRDLYLAIRSTLDQLCEMKSPARADAQLEKVDAELQAIHDELLRVYEALMIEGPDGRSFHDLAGEWLATRAPELDGLDPASLEGLSLADFEGRRSELDLCLQRAAAVGLAHNPWAACAGGTLDAYLSRPADGMRRVLASCVEDARAADATRDDAIPAFDPQAELAAQARDRAAIADALRALPSDTPKTVLNRAASLEEREIADLERILDSTRPHRQALGERPLDRELELSIRGQWPALGRVQAEIGELTRYLDASSKWWGFLAFSAKSAAGRTLRPYGLATQPQDALRLRDFLQGLRDRMLVVDALQQLRGLPAALGQPAGAAPSDPELTVAFDAFDAALRVRRLAAASPAMSQGARAALADPEHRESWLRGLDLSGPRAEALAQLEGSLGGSGLFDPAWLDQARAHARAGRKLLETLERLRDRFDTLEGVLRVRDALEALPPALRRAVDAVIQGDGDPQTGLAALSRAVIARELQSRMQAQPVLHRLDEQRLQHNLTRYAELEQAKRALVRDAILHRWISLQKSRLVVGTGSRLNSMGADLRRRLFVRGNRALRLRQVIAAGESIEGGDPMLDLCPVWMASPETVAQVFPRREVFDVVIFDEASQCRLEEALPVLLRAKRVVIAGDPRQLPPTRFFESAVASSEDEALDTDQDLFEAQQAEVEDLLAAALNLQVEESYLDVHYRSRNSDLIEFSNRQFYQSRLQAIPGHPSKLSKTAPLTLHRVEGVYEDRSNELEARRVVEIVQELLAKRHPPSIGVACFNIAQRDLITELLDERAAEDERFSDRLSKARQRRGEGSFEGLFVKNLENVQGDERDHIIISTTYAPNPEGRFHRRFGPLGMAGGGRRLNVLVTRARERVHLVTSIPREAYLNAEPVPQGMTPTGGWLLFAYLRFAEELEALYDPASKSQSQPGAAEEPLPAQLVHRPIEPVSAFGIAIARRLHEDHKLGCDAHWGNEGFCVDAALHHPARAGDVTVGLLTDFTRYGHAPDPVAWEVFRTGVLEATGWTLHRVWSPAFFRDPRKAAHAITLASQTAALKSGA